MQQVLDFGVSIHPEQDHPLQVKRLACQLFGELQTLHRMGNTERIWLQAAALLHDIGKAKKRRNHNKHSCKYIIKTGDLPFNKTERVLIGLIARYHRGPLPKIYHRYYSNLNHEQRLYVQKLAGLLRFADGLDDTHDGAVVDLSCTIRRNLIKVSIYSHYPFSENKSYHKTDLLQRVFHRDFQLYKTDIPYIPGRSVYMYANLDKTMNPFNLQLCNITS